MRENTGRVRNICRNCPTYHRVKCDKQLDDVGQGVGLAEHAHHGGQRPNDGPVAVPAGIVAGHLDEDPEDEDGQLGLVKDGGAASRQGPLELGHLLQQPPALHTLGPHLCLGRDRALLIQIYTQPDRVVV